MAIVLPTQQPGVSSGESLLQGLFGGLKAAAGPIASNLEQKQRSFKTAKGLEALGLSPKEAQQLASLPKEYIPEAMKFMRQKISGDRFDRGFFGAEDQGQGAGQPGLTAQQEDQAGLDDLLFGQGGAQGMSKPQGADQSYQNALEVLMGGGAGPGAPTQGLAGIASLMGPQSPAQAQALGGAQSPMPAQAPQSNALDADEEGIVPGLETQPTQPTGDGKREYQTQKGTTGKPQAQSPVFKEAVRQARRAGLTPAESLKSGYEAVRIQNKEMAAERKERAEAFKETKDFRKDIIENAKKARATLADLDRLDELNRKGDLDGPNKVEFLKRAGLDIPALLRPDTQEFRKVAQAFMRDTKQYFGGNVTNNELEAFLKTIPSMLQTPEGTNRVISNMKRINRMALEYNKALRDTMRDNKRTPPLDIMEQVDERMEKRSEKIAKQFRDDLNREIPRAAEDPHFTALGAVTGSILGTPGKALGALGKLLSV